MPVAGTLSLMGVFKYFLPLFNNKIAERQDVGSEWENEKLQMVPGLDEKFFVRFICAHVVHALNTWPWGHSVLKAACQHLLCVSPSIIYNNKYI